MDGIGRNAGPRCAGERTQRAAVVLTKLPEVEPDMPKMHRHGGFSLFYPWCASAHLRPEKQTSIRAAILFGARSFQRDGFRAGKVSIFAILPYGNNCNAIRAESSR